RADGDRTFAALAALQAVCLALCYRELRQRTPRRNWLGVLLAFLPCLALAGGIGVFLRWVEGSTNDWVNFLDPVIPLSANFATRSKLTAMLNSARSESVVLRLFSKAPPGYVVARSYSTFRQDAWESRTARPTVVPQATGRLQGLPTFQLFPGRALWLDRIELATPAGGQLVLPRDTLQVALDTPEVKRDGSTAVIVSPAFRGAYYLARGNVPGDSLTGPEYSDVPQDLPPVVPSLAAHICSGLDSPEEKARAVETYMQRNFQYGFGYPFSDRTSTLEQFLEKRPPAHCEFFATAMATMLRTQGVPTRYVVGFVVDPTDRNPIGGYFMVRGRHAHAWVEVYLNGRWETFDPTPPGSRILPRSWLTRVVGKLVDYVLFQYSRLRDFFRLSPRQMLQAAWRAVKGLLAYLAAHPAALLVLLGCLTGLHLLRQRGLLRWRRQGAGFLEESDDGVLGPLLARFARQLRRHGLERPPHRTLLEWAAQLPPGELQAPAREFLEIYCRARYARTDEHSALAALLARIEAVRPSGRRQSSRAS
ncbi:MAG: transglutaminase domain-containing protein, partial [Candidatus Eremiobacterota bacterium]